MKGAIDDLKEVSFENFLHLYSDGKLDLCKRTSYDSPQALKHTHTHTHTESKVLNFLKSIDVSCMMRIQTCTVYSN